MVFPQHLTIVAMLAAGALALPASAQTGHSQTGHSRTGQSTHPGPGGHHGAMHGTKSAHPTPKRQHVMEQMQRAHSTRHQNGTQNSETDRLNSQSLQRVQQGDGGAPAGAGMMGTMPGANPVVPAR